MATGFTRPDLNNVRFFIGDQEVGQVQTLTLADRPNRNQNVYRMGYEGTLTMNNTQINYDYINQLFGMGLENKEDYYKEFNSNITRQHFKNVRVNMNPSWSNEDYAQELLNKEEPF